MVAGTLPALRTAFDAVVPAALRGSALSWMVLAIALVATAFVVLLRPGDLEKVGYRLFAGDAVDRLAEQRRDAQRSDLEAVQLAHWNAIRAHKFGDFGVFEPRDAHVAQHRVRHTRHDFLRAVLL